MITKFEHGIELEQGDTKLLYEYDQSDVLFMSTKDEEDLGLEFDKAMSYPEFIYEYLGNNEETREFIMEIAKQRCETKLR